MSALHAVYGTVPNSHMYSLDSGKLLPVRVPVAQCRGTKADLSKKDNQNITQSHFGSLVEKLDCTESHYPESILFCILS